MQKGRHFPFSTGRRLSFSSGFFFSKNIMSTTVQKISLSINIKYGKDYPTTKEQLIPFMHTIIKNIPENLEVSDDFRIEIYSSQYDGMDEFNANIYLKNS